MTTPDNHVRIGTRRSQLAMTQAGQVAQMLREHCGLAAELVEIRTDGDRSQAAGTPLAGGSTGVFVHALRDALVAGEVDIAVHSLKDLPTYPAPGLTLAAVPRREDPRDVVVARDGLTLGELAQGSVVGTGAPRRVAQLHALGLGLEVVGIRGNVDTRIGKIVSGECDAVVIARAGLARLGRLDEATEILDPIQMLPAPGQGALAIECRTEDAEMIDRLAVLDDLPTRLAVTAERAALATLEGGCSAPVGALAEHAEGEDGPELWLRAVVLSTDGSLSVRRSLAAPVRDIADGDSRATEADRQAAADLGSRLATEMLDEGAGQLETELEDPAQPARPAEVHNA